jgi:hypothetical protein
MDKGHWSDLVEYSWRFLILIAGRYPSGRCDACDRICVRCRIFWWSGEMLMVSRLSNVLNKRTMCLLPVGVGLSIAGQLCLAQTQSIAPKPPEALFPLCRVAKMCG